MELRFDPPMAFQDALVPKGTGLVGWAALVHALGLKAPVRQPSCVSDNHVRGSRTSSRRWWRCCAIFWVTARGMSRLALMQPPSSTTEPVRQ